MIPVHFSIFVTKFKLLSAFFCHLGLLLMHMFMSSTRSCSVWDNTKCNTQSTSCGHCQLMLMKNYRMQCAPKKLIDVQWNFHGEAEGFHGNMINVIATPLATITSSLKPEQLKKQCIPSQYVEIQCMFLINQPLYLAEQQLEQKYHTGTCYWQFQMQWAFFQCLLFGLIIGVYP